MRILVWHGYLLAGTGSNVYTRALVHEWSRAGHEVVVFSQEPHPEAYDLGGAETVRPDQVMAFLDQTADPQPCPTFLPPTYESFFGVGTESGQFYACQGGPGYTSWYGNGQVDAFNAVTHASGNG